MRVHFSAAQPCLLRLGGALAGYCGDAEKFVDLTTGDKTIAEFFPLRNDLKPLAFVLDESFFEEPPAGCILHRYDCGIDLYVESFSPRETGTKLIGQLRSGDLLATVFSNAGNAQLVLERNSVCEMYDLPFADSYDLSEDMIGGESFIFLHCKSPRKNILYVLGRQAKILLRTEADEWTCGETLTVKKHYQDIARHTAESIFTPGEPFALKNKNVFCSKDFDPALLHERLLPFAFFQEIAAGGDPSAYLSDSLLSKIDLLGEYLGNFCAAVLPKEIFYLTHGKYNAAGLVYPVSERLFDIKFFLAETEHGKIINVKPIENIQ